MSPIRLERTVKSQPGKSFGVFPFGERELADGTTFDFDDMFRKLVKVCRELGLELTRADTIYGKGDVMGTAWHGIQEAEIVIVDCSLQRPNVAAELALSIAAGKRIILIVQDPEDIPSDVKGHYRYIKYGPDWREMDGLVEELKKEIPALLEQPPAEMTFKPMLPGGAEPVAGKVIAVTKEFATVMTADGHRVVLGADEVDYRRIIPDMTRMFPEGTDVHGAFAVDLAGAPRYTLVAGQNNPWPRLVNDYAPGSGITGTIESVVPGVGAFVHVAHGVNGLIPEGRLNGRRVAPGAKVQATVAQIDPGRRRIALRLERTLGAVDAPAASTADGEGSADRPGISIGDTFDSEVVKVVPEGKGGYILTRRAQGNEVVMLHRTAMSDALLSDLRSGEVQPGDQLYVEVISVSGNGRICVKDRPDLDDAAIDGEGPKSGVA